MKITKKFLIIFFTCVLLAATVFGTVASALKAGETTTVEEYRTMHKVGDDDFETGYPTTFKSNVLNGASPLTGGVERWSRYRPATAGVYGMDDEYSDYFYTLDYNYNYGGPQNNASPVYMQPMLGVLNDIETTPANGFVMEFDIAFWSPLIPVTIPAVDAEGNPVMEDKKDAEYGFIIYKDVYYEVGESELEVAYFNGAPQLDIDGKVILVAKKDQHGNPVIVTEANTVKKIEVVYDENGNYVMEDGKVKTKVKQVPEQVQARETVTEPQINRVRDLNGNIVWVPIYDGDVQVGKEPKMDVTWEDIFDEKYRKMTYGQLGITEIDVPVYTKYGQLVYRYEKQVFDGVEAEVLVLETTKQKVNADDTAKRIVTTPVYVKGNPVDLMYKDAYYNSLGDLVEKSGACKLQVDMYNTYTWRDGIVRLLEFTTDASNNEVKVQINKDVNIDNTTSFKTFKYDEWTHFAIQFVAETQTVYIYIGGDEGDGRVLLGQAIATASIDNNGGAIGPVYPLAFRIGVDGMANAEGYQTYANKGIISFDNLLAYQGVTIHNPDMIKDIESKDPHGLFKYLMKVLENKDGSNSAVSRYYAFKDADQDGFLSTYYKDGEATAITRNDSELVKALDVYLSYKTGFSKKFDEFGNPVLDGQGNIVEEPNTLYADLFETVCDENALTFENYVSKVTATDRTLANIAERSAKISVAESFLSDVSKEINVEHAGYQQASKDLQIAKAAVESDIASNEFIKFINLFVASVNYDGASVERIKHHYENACLHYENISIYEDGDTTEPKPLSASDKSKLRSAVNTYLGSGSTPSAEEIVKQNVTRWNSERFIKVVSLISERGFDFASDDGTTENLWRIAYEIISGGEYEENVDGFHAAMVVYNEAHNYFWVKLQNQHIAIITAKLNSFNDTNSSLIDKKGICQYVKQYWNTNLEKGDIDENNETLKALIQRTLAYEQQLEQTLEADYQKLLTQNTVKFVNTVKFMAEYTAYADIKSYYDEATEYYYSMNLVYDEDGDGNNDIDIDGAVAIYEAARARLALIEEDCTMFIAHANSLENAKTKDKVYSALVGCYDSTTYLDDTYEGVREAKAKYNQAYADYTNAADVVQKHIAQTNEIVCSVRGNWSIDSIVAFVRQYFN